MANATTKVQSTVSEWGDDKITRPTAAAAATYYPGAMIARDASGNAVKCDDTAGIAFDGINAESVRVTVVSGESAGDHELKVSRPWRFQMAIAAAAAGEEGTAVYAKYDNEVAYSGVSNSILVGWVDKVLDATHVLVNPIYGPLTNLSVADNTLTFDGATTANTIVMPDNLADALNIKEGANSYLKFTTTDAGERIVASKNLSFLDNVGVMLGTGEDVVVAWDATRLNVTQAAANSEIRWGVDGAGIDQMWYGDTASAFANWDQSADALIFGGAAGIKNIKSKQTTAVAITGATSVVLADSGGIFTVGQGSAYDIDLPSPTTGAGATYFFSLTAPAANAVTITVTGSAATFVGSIISEGQIIVATGSTLTFASGAAVLGDSVEIRSIATNLYHVRAVSSILNGITVS
jgi:hypothetical protein